MAGPTLEIQPPVRVERVGGIKSVATFRSNDRIGNAEAIVFQSDGCTFPQTEEVRCFAAEEQPDKTFDGIEVDGAIGAPFVLYAGTKCLIAEGSAADYQERARRILEQGHDRELEEILGEWAAGGTGLQAGVDVKNAIGIVEQALDSQYLGQGVILMSRRDALNAGLDVATPFRTAVGTPVIASGRIAPGTVYGIGAITIEQSTTKTYQTVDVTTNTDWALAEQVFAIAVDCEYRVKSSTSIPN